MSIKVKIKKNTYFDSVSLMSLTTKTNEIEGIDQAVIAMGTEMNKEVLKNVDMLVPELDEVKNGDLMIVVRTKDDDSSDQAILDIEELMSKKAKPMDSKEISYSTLDSAVKNVSNANMVVISVPGEYVAREAQKALDNDLNVMIFSDNVSIEDEIKLKKDAHEKGLLLMGPDCGTAIINNIGLCFANEVREGNIGIVGASGTGSQEISVKIDDFGGGVSQLIGTGGRDLSEEVGGIMMIDGMRALNSDEKTKVIVLISKPPAKSIEEKVLAEIKTFDKPVVVCFIGGSEKAVEDAGGIFAKTTKEAAFKAVILSGKSEDEIKKEDLDLQVIESVKKKLTDEQKYIRGLFCGGTLCDEAMHIVKEKHKEVYSNTTKDPDHKLQDISKSKANTFLDLGDDEFTRGKPHPMIEPALRIPRFVEESKDPSVGVILMDFVLGLGSHPDPAGVMIPSIIEAKALAKEEGRHLEILGYVLGTDKDFQGLEEQISKLEDAGVTIATSITNAALLASGFIEKEVKK